MIKNTVRQIVRNKLAKCSEAESVLRRDITRTLLHVRANGAEGLTVIVYQVVRAKQSFTMTFSWGWSFSLLLTFLTGGHETIAASSQFQHSDFE